MKKLVALLILVTLALFQPVNAKTNFAGFVGAIEDSRKLKITIDFENTAKQFGYKNFKQFFDEYKKKYDLEDLTIDEAKEFLTGTDRTVEIIESEENLKILHRLILKDKLLKKYLRKKKEHAKVLAIYFDYEKEMAKITKNPNLDKIGRFAFHWMWHTEKGPDTYNGQYADARDGCEENRKKRGVPDGGKCMLIDYRYGDQFKILLQPKIVKKNKIVKKEPSQTQKVTSKKLNFICIENDINSNENILPKYRLIPSSSKVLSSSYCSFSIYENDFRNTYNKIDLKYAGEIVSITGYELNKISKQDGIFTLSSGSIELNKGFKFLAISGLATARVIKKGQTQVISTYDAKKNVIEKNKIVKKTENNSKESVSQSKKTLPRSYLKTATPDTFLNLEEVDDLTKSVAKYDNSMMSQAEYLFGSNKNYYDSDLQRVSQKKISDIYVTGKRTLDKNPYKTIIGMAYFEFFYAGQVKKNIQKINKFKDTYPNIKSNKAVKDLYNLNEVRKKMRESIGFSLESESADVLRSYITLSKYLKNSTAKKIKLSSSDKKIISYSQNFNKFLSVYEKNIKLRQYNRISEKKFYRELNRSYKKLSTFDKKINKLSNEQENTSHLKVLYKNIYEVITITNNNLTSGIISTTTTSKYQLALDSVCFANNLIKLTKLKIIKNKYEQVWPLDFKIENELNKEEMTDLTQLGLNTKKNKFINNAKFQSCALNLINNNYPINKIVTAIENELNVKINSIKMNYESIDKMKAWKRSDWADSWKGSLPLDLNDSKGNLIDFSDQDIEDLKAQLALNNFSKLFDNNEINNLNFETQDIQSSIQDIQSTNISNLLNQDFSITLDNYSRILAEDAISRFGDQFDANTIQEIRDNANFENLTVLTNMEYGTNMTSAEYKSYWENAQYMDSTSTWGDVTRGVDLISNLGSFDAAAAAKELGADLQTVADSIAQAASVGISTDLEAAAQGLGYDSFSAAVDAYNAEHGTSYTDAEAKEALGQ